MSETNTLTGQRLTKKELSSVVALVERKIALEAEVAVLEEQVKARNEILRNLNETLIPDLMSEVGLSELKLESGLKLTIKPFYNAKIPDDKKQAAFAWLRTTQNDGIIKSFVELAFGKGSDEQFQKCQNLLLKHHFEFSADESVHPQTLKAFVKEQLEAAKPLPLDLFGVFQGKRAVVK
jgi:hypothetical protein